MRRMIWCFGLSCLLGVGSLLHGAYSSLDAEQRQQFNEFLDAAFNAYVNEDYQRALQFFQKALAMDPKDKTALKGLEECKDHLDQLNREKISLQKSILGLARKAMKEEQWVEAIDHINDVLSSTKNQSEALALRAEIEVSLKKKMSTIPVESSDYLIYQGIYFYANKRYPEAIRVWKDALTMAKDHVKLSIFLRKADQLYKESQQFEVMTVGRRRARAAFESQNYQESVNLWKKIIEVDSQDVEARRELKNAEEFLNRKNKENLLGEYYDKGLAMYLEGNFLESLKYWEGILTFSPDNEVAKEYIKKIKLKGVEGAGRADSAPTSLQKSSGAVITDPTKKSDSNQQELEELPVTLYDKGIQLYQLGEYQQSLEVFEKLLEKTPEDLQVKEWIENVKKERVAKAEEHYQQGLIAYSRGHIKEAIREWEISLEIYPQHAASHRTLMKVKGEYTQ